MNKKYVKPSMKVIKIQHQYQLLLGGSQPGQKVYFDETMDAGSAMGRGGSDWDDDDE